MICANRLKEVLNEKNMTQQELSDASGVSKANISNYINGKRKPSNITSGQLSQVLGVSPLWLMGFNVDRDGNTDINQLFGVKTDVEKKSVEKKTITYSDASELMDIYMEETGNDIMFTKESAKNMKKLVFKQYQDLIGAVANLTMEEMILLSNLLINPDEKENFFSYLKFRKESKMPKNPLARVAKELEEYDKILPQAERNTQQMNNKETIKKE